VDREPWDFDAFVRAYNARADEFGGWHWDGSVPPATLRKHYEGAPIWPTVREFALTRFQCDQEF
jgi:hypothetical protein